MVHSQKPHSTTRIGSSPASPHWEGGGPATASAWISGTIENHSPLLGVLCAHKSHHWSLCFFEVSWARPSYAHLPRFIIDPTHSATLSLIICHSFQISSRRLRARGFRDSNIIASGELACSVSDSAPPGFIRVVGSLPSCPRSSPSATRFSLCLRLLCTNSSSL